MNILRSAVLCWIMSLPGCGDVEPNIILNRAPFYHDKLAFSLHCEEAIIRKVKAFSQTHNMIFALAQKSLEREDFNASANGASLNLKAMHVTGIEDGVSVFAIATASPTAADKALVKDFVSEVDSCH